MHVALGGPARTGPLAVCTMAQVAEPPSAAGLCPPDGFELLHPAAATVAQSARISITRFMVALSSTNVWSGGASPRAPDVNLRCDRRTLNRDSEGGMRTWRKL